MRTKNSIWIWVAGKVQNDPAAMLWTCFRERECSHAAHILTAHRLAKQALGSEVTLEVPAALHQGRSEKAPAGAVVWVSGVHLLTVSSRSCLTSRSLVPICEMGRILLTPGVVVRTNWDNSGKIPPHRVCEKWEFVMWTLSLVTPEASTWTPGQPGVEQRPGSGARKRRGEQESWNFLPFGKFT